MSNRIVAAALLIALLIFIAPNFLPRLVSMALPGAYEGIPCEWLRNASDPANHQSLLGRGAPNPLRISVRTSAIPTDPTGSLYVYISILNDSFGTVPFVYNPNQVIIGDNGTDGLGIIFTPQTSLIAGTRNQFTSFPNSDIRLLTPRQRCVHTLQFPGGSVLADPAFRTGQVSVRAFYRGTTRGAVAFQPNIGGVPVPTPIYTDQGLWTGYVESLPVQIPLPVG